MNMERRNDVMERALRQIAGSMGTADCLRGMARDALAEMQDDEPFIQRLGQKILDEAIDRINADLGALQAELREPIRAELSKGRTGSWVLMVSRQPKSTTHWHAALPMLREKRLSDLATALRLIIQQRAKRTAGVQ